MYSTHALVAVLFSILGIADALAGHVEVTNCQPSWRKGQNFFGINLAFYKAHSSMFKVGSFIEVAGIVYYIDAMNIPNNCNAGVALVYVANREECVDGTPWVKTEECGFGGVLTDTVNVGDSWQLLEQDSSDWSCDKTKNFIVGAEYDQIDLTSACPKCSSDPVYGAPNSNERAVAYCKWKCEDSLPCVGFFYQRHINGHEICGFYNKPIPSNAQAEWGGHSQGSRICMKMSPLALAGHVEVTDCQPSWRKGQNFFGINLAFYKAHSSMFKVGSFIEVAGILYYIDAMNIPNNCNAGVALVYVANREECVDGTPWVKTEECGFGGVLTATVNAGDSWQLLVPAVAPTGASTKTSVIHI